MYLCRIEAIVKAPDPKDIRLELTREGYPTSDYKNYDILLAGTRIGDVTMRQREGLLWVPELRAYVNEDLELKGDQLVERKKPGKHLDWTVREIKIDKKYRGKGLGTKVYQDLVKLHGTILSDTIETSPSADAVWKKLGAKTFPFRCYYENDSIDAAKTWQRFWLGKRPVWLKR